MALERKKHAKANELALAFLLSMVVLTEIQQRCTLYCCNDGLLSQSYSSPSMLYTAIWTRSTCIPQASRLDTKAQPALGISLEIINIGATANVAPTTVIIAQRFHPVVCDAYDCSCSTYCRMVSWNIMLATFRWLGDLVCRVSYSFLKYFFMSSVSSHFFAPLVALLPHGALSIPGRDGALWAREHGDGMGEDRSGEELPTTLHAPGQHAAYPAGFAPSYGMAFCAGLPSLSVS